MKQALPLFLAVSNVLFCVGSFPPKVTGQDASAESSQPKQPRILYNSRRIVEYQLRRLSNQQLVLVQRDTSDRKYLPVYEALLSRPGLGPQYRQKAIAGLSTLNKSDRVTELMAGIERLQRVDSSDASVLHELAVQLTTAPSRDLKLKRTGLEQVATGSQHALTRRVAFAAMVVADGGLDRVWAAAEKRDETLVDVISAIPMIPDAKLRDAFYPRIESLINQAPDGDVRNSAISVIGLIRGHDARTFATLAELIQNDQGREAAIVSIRRIDKTVWPAKRIGPLVDSLVAYAQSLPVTQRDSGVFLEAMALGFDLVEKLPKNRAVSLRKALRSMSVSVFLIKTINHQMLYDRTKIVVEAGKHVSVVLENDDIMPHNLVITMPGAHEEIGAAAEAMAAMPDARAKGYIPDSNKILWATKLLQPGQKEKLSFLAPRQPGVYPYVCTYPGHWRRMFGAMYVVADLGEYHADPNAYLAKHPLPILDELLNYNRSRTQWKLEQLAPSLEQLVDGRSFDKAMEVFRVANCVACHRLNGVGGEFGPNLTKLDPKLGASDILEEILDPSKKINEDFHTYIFAIESGRIITGLIVEETADVVKVIENPLAGSRPIEIKKTEIEVRKKSAVSIMPAGLLDKLTREEILDLVAYVVSGGDRDSRMFHEGHMHE